MRHRLVPGLVLCARLIQGQVSLVGFLRNAAASLKARKVNDLLMNT